MEEIEKNNEWIFDTLFATGGIEDKETRDDIKKRSEGNTAVAKVLISIAEKGMDVYNHVVPQLGTGLTIWSVYRDEFDQNLDKMIKKYSVTSETEIS